MLFKGVLVSAVHGSALCTHIRKIGARGLRAVLESIMTGIMYEIPSDPTITKVIVTETCVREGIDPEVVRNTEPDGDAQVS